MKINSLNFSIACGLATAMLWIFCSFLVWVLPAEMEEMSGHMVHLDLAGFGWHLTVQGFLIGLVVWSSMAALAGGAVSIIYNQLSAR